MGLLIVSDWRIWFPMGFFAGMTVSSLILHLLHRQHLKDLWQMRDECKKLREEIKGFWDKPSPGHSSGTESDLTSLPHPISEGKRRTMWG